jgi:hypothetical protein
MHIEYIVFNADLMKLVLGILPRCKVGRRSWLYWLCSVNLCYTWRGLHLNARKGRVLGVSNGIASRERVKTCK